MTKTPLMNTTIICYDMHGQPHEVPVSALSFRPAVYGIIVRDGHVLAHRMGDKYDLPGGGMEVHETLHEALLREIREETGLEIDPIDLVHADSSLFYLPGIDVPVNSIGHFYHCEVVGGEVNNEGQDGWERGVYEETHWIPLAQAVELRFNHPMAVPALRKLLARLG